MKTIMRNTLLGCLLLGTASMATAQQSASGYTTNAPAAQSLNAIQSSAPVVATTIGNGYTYSSDGNFYSGKDFKDHDLKSKEVSKEIAVSKTSEIYIENASRDIVVKTWDQPKVKITTTIYYDGETKLTDDEWLEKVNLSLKTLGSSVKIKSGGVSSNGLSSYSSPGVLFNSSGSGGSGGVAVFNGNGQNIGTKANLKRIVTITVPAGSKLDIESKYSDVTLPAGIGDANVDITNGNLEADNLGKLVLRSKYSNANIGDVKTAEIEFSNGRFSAKNIDDLDIESKSSTIEMAAVKKIIMRSTSDDYELEEAGEVSGRKAYGNLRITKLNGSLEVDGMNADMKIRKVGPALSLIKIDDKYADIRIPLRETKSYSVDFTGRYSSVYGNFEKKEVKEEKTTAAADEKNKVSGTIVATTAPAAASRFDNVYVTGNLARGTVWGNEGTGPARFTATVGDGKGLKIDMKCTNCTVDFK
ncbi:MAG: hypothetical protein JWQ30_1333 [Sediminibacterium sp.]|nr:hypothetical protein [Sediminibacterium sp.]